MNVFTKQKQTHRHRAWTRSCRGEKGGLGLQSQKMQAITHRMNKQASPAVQHMQPFSTSIP